MTFPVRNLPWLKDLSKNCNFSFFLPTTIYLLRHAYYSFTFNRDNPPLLICSLLRNIISGLGDWFLSYLKAPNSYMAGFLVQNNAFRHDWFVMNLNISILTSVSSFQLTLFQRSDFYKWIQFWSINLFRIIFISQWKICVDLKFTNNI